MADPGPIHPASPPRRKVTPGGFLQPGAKPRPSPTMKPIRWVRRKLTSPSGQVVEVDVPVYGAMSERQVLRTGFEGRKRQR